MPEKEKRKKYREIMMDFPNHTPRDYSDLLVNHIMIEGKTLKNGEKEIRYTNYMLISFLFRFTFYWILIGFLFIAPLVFLIRPLLALNI